MTELPRKSAMKPDRTTTAVLGMEHVGEAFMKLRDMNLGQREQLADEVHAAQPNLFYSVLVLNRYGASFVQMEVVLNILFVFYLAMKATVATHHRGHPGAVFDAPYRSHTLH